MFSSHGIEELGSFLEYDHTKKEFYTQLPLHNFLVNKIWKET